MSGNRVLYSVILASAIAFYAFDTNELAFSILLLFLILPLFSLLLSLPAMLLCRVELSAPPQAVRGGAVRCTISIKKRCILPVGAVRLRIKRHNLLNGLSSPYEKLRYYGVCALDEALPLPTAHCGTLELQASRVRVCDLMGLFALPKRAPAPLRVTILPAVDNGEAVPDSLRAMVSRRKPKPGGGYAEEHELRPYREGDPVNSIHWKLTGKLDEPVVREPVVPVEQRILVTLYLCGDAARLDKSLSQLMRLSDALLSNGLPFLLQCPTVSSSALTLRRIENERGLSEQLGALCSLPAPAAYTPDGSFDAARADRHFLIGAETESEETA